MEKRPQNLFCFSLPFPLSLSIPFTSGPPTSTPRDCSHLCSPTFLLFPQKEADTAKVTILMLNISSHQHYGDAVWRTLTMASRVLLVIITARNHTCQSTGQLRVY